MTALMHKKRSLRVMIAANGGYVEGRVHISFSRPVNELSQGIQFDVLGLLRGYAGKNVELRIIAEDAYVVGHLSEEDWQRFAQMLNLRSPESVQSESQSPENTGNTAPDIVDQSGRDVGERSPEWRRRVELASESTREEAKSGREMREMPALQISIGVLSQ